MKQIDGLVTKDEMYRLISGFRTRFKISEEAGHEMAKRVAEMPTIETEPVKHGKWIEKKVSRMKWIPYADDDVNPDDVGIECMTEQKCSYCKRWTIKFTCHIELDYCPLCGARMDGDNNDKP